ncbi:MAG: NAD(P)-dependent alcohol dehydrogenase [Candidatus Hodarchaeales archaeon]|jgi:NADPH:quinone reductase-like Zn-dependent oxidoreductase
MKAMVFTKYGDPDVLHLKEIEKPSPKDDEILVKVQATTVTVGDVMARRKVTLKNFNMPILLYPIIRLMFGIRKPKKSIQILGTEFGGEVESVGRDVESFSPGDKVFGYRADKFGANTEYLCVPEKSLVAKMPADLSFEEVVPCTYGTLTSYLLLKDRVQKGSKILINGASGSIGGFGVQVAKYLGAEVTGVCSTTKVDYVKALGAHKVIDYTKEDFTKNGETYDIIFDILGKSSFSKVKKSLNKNGRYLCASFSTRKLFQMIVGKLLRRSKRIVCAMAIDKPEDILNIKELIEAGHVKSILDKQYSLEQLPEAHAYVEEGHKKGAVLIKL